MTLVYRAMKRDADGLPLVNHTSSSGLGVRPGKDIHVDSEGFVDPQSEGMTVAPDSPENIHRPRRPSEYGGLGKYPAWELDTEGLPDTLVYTPEREDHGFIEPAYRMGLQDYQDAIAETRDLWGELN
jgi:hypothetical protein